MRLLPLLLACALAACNTPRDADVAAALDRRDAASGDAVPDWAADAVWYQIFPDRFRNGDPGNDPTRASLEVPVLPDTSWRVSPWTGAWYSRSAWETAMGPDFYENGVFHRRYGGDLQGVIDRLGYLETLGVNALYFNPLFWGRSLHKYDGNTFHHIDPYFGPDPDGDFARMARETADPATWQTTRADSLFFALVAQAHQRGMRVIIDGVFNHTGRDFFAFADLRKNGAASPYRDWYIVRRFDDPATPADEFSYRGWYGVQSLPEFANNADSTTLADGPRAYVFSATRRWMDPDGDGDPSDGVDGWRLDAAEQVPLGFWRDWNAYVRQLNPDAYTVAELWADTPHFVAEGGFSASMNYEAFAFPTKGFFIDGVLPARAFADTLDARRRRYPERVQHAMQNLIDSHDTERLASMIVNAGRVPYERPERWGYDWGGGTGPRGDRAYLTRPPTAREREIQRLVALFQATYVGAPLFYYGDEVGMWGADDPDSRKPMLWDDLRYAPEKGFSGPAYPVAVDTALFDFYRDVIALRSGSDLFSRGDYETLVADSDRQLFAFRRAWGRSVALVIFNRSDTVQRARIPLDGERGATPFRVQFATTDGPYRADEDAGALVVEIPARTGLVLQP